MNCEGEIWTPAILQLPLGLSALFQNSSPVLSLGPSPTWQTLSGWGITGPSAQPPSLFISNASSLNQTSGVYTVQEQSTLLVSLGLVGALAEGASGPVQVAIVLNRSTLPPYQIAQCYGASILNGSTTGAGPNFQATLATTGAFQAGDQLSVQILNNTGVSLNVYPGSFTYLSITPVNK